MKWFFVFNANEFPEGSGFALYGPEHLLALLAITLGVIAVSIAYGRVRYDDRLFFRRVTAGFCFMLELFKQSFMFATLPSYPVSQLPLYMCSLGIFIEIADAFAPRWNKTTSEILYSLIMPGAASALIFPDWPMYPILNFYSLQSFIFHGVLLCYPIMLLTGRQLKPDWRNLWRPALFILAVVGPIHYLDKRFGTNFLFLNESSPGSPLELLQGRLGYPGYLIGYAALVLMVWMTLYAPYIIGELLKKRRNSID